MFTVSTRVPLNVDVDIDEVVERVDDVDEAVSFMQKGDEDEDEIGVVVVVVFALAWSLEFRLASLLSFMVSVIRDEEVVLDGEQATIDLSVFMMMSVEPALSNKSKLLLVVDAEHTLDDVLEWDMV